MPPEDQFIGTGLRSSLAFDQSHYGRGTGEVTQKSVRFIASNRAVSGGVEKSQEKTGLKLSSSV